MSKARRARSRTSVVVKFSNLTTTTRYSGQSGQDPFCGASCFVGLPGRVGLWDVQRFQTFPRPRRIGHGGILLGSEVVRDEVDVAGVRNPAVALPAEAQLHIVPYQVAVGSASSCSEPGAVERSFPFTALPHAGDPGPRITLPRGLVRRERRGSSPWIERPWRPHRKRETRRASGPLRGFPCAPS